MVRSVARLDDVLLAHVPDDRHQQPVRGFHGDAEMVLALEQDLLSSIVDGGVQIGVFL
jgi:hypothetical protein